MKRSTSDREILKFSQHTSWEPFNERLQGNMSTRVTDTHPCVPPRRLDSDGQGNLMVPLPLVEGQGILQSTRGTPRLGYRISA